MCCAQTGEKMINLPIEEISLEWAANLYEERGIYYRFEKKDPFRNDTEILGVPICDGIKSPLRF